ncbi:flippase-like domain-containing protein [Cupriavidus oxalaticus]|uniref:Flippase-like domain-containing protein n=1 Tax=Cupriavidus oxalaticus TaxID=96344 RepID=A0A4P7LC99_9BURK|nr:flippase-like domain-containing protein [Cupriavidus oxalaticus]QBY53155.1 flippase-like domain-containing protein [Cupriavidus oxalaticus]
MTRAAMVSLSVGAALFVALIAFTGFGSVASTLMSAGWLSLLVVMFHLLPLALDAGAIFVLFDRHASHRAMRDALFARWVGESVNSLLPAGQLGGPVLMVRHLAQRGARMRDAAAAITVSTTMQAIAQLVFAVLGLVLFGASTASEAGEDVRLPVIAVTALLALCLFGFYVAQRRGLFGRVLRLLSKLRGKRDWAALTMRADAVDAAVRRIYRAPGKVAATFALSLAGWLVGTGEVWLALRFLGHPVSWLDALLLESAGQAIRGAAFAIPGSLGVQEAGYLLLAPLVGLPADAALALSLIKRAREIVLGAPGLLYLYWSERRHRRRSMGGVPATD